MKPKPASIHEVCYSRATLADFVLGKLPDAELEQIAKQVEACPTCNAVLQTLDSLEDSMVDDLKQQLSSCSGQPSPDLERRLRRAEALGYELWQTQAKSAAADEATPPPVQDETRVETLGPYELVERIGQGGMGAVYKARHVHLKRTVAVKLLRTERTCDPRAVARFQAEMEAVGRLDHPNLVRAHDAGEAEGRHFLVMEHVDGLDLARLVRSSGPLPVADACEIIRQVAIGLHHAHQHGLVHRDVKPSNVMRTADGGVKILDLGLARLLHDQPATRQLTETGQVLGTGDYIAPEQGQDAGNADARSDIYSLGCTLYFLLAGQAPFAGPQHRTFIEKVVAHATQPFPPITAVRADIPEPLVTILERMTAKSPTERFQTAGDVAAALEQLTAAKGSRNASAPRLPRLARKSWLLGGFLLLVATLVFLGQRHGERSVDPAQNRLDPIEAQRAIEPVNADFGQTAGDIRQAHADMQRELDAPQAQSAAASAERSKPASPSSPPPSSPPPSPPTRSLASPTPPKESASLRADARQSDTFDIWQVIGPFLYASRDEAYDAAHVIEQEPFDANRRFDTPEGPLGWRRFEAAPASAGKITLVEAAGEAPPAGRVGVYYAVCWAKFAGSHRTVNIHFWTSCAYKLWINRTPIKGTPNDNGASFGGGISARGGTSGWNEFLFKFVVSAKRKTRADFQFGFRRPADRFGRPLDQPLPLITIEPPQDRKAAAPKSPSDDSRRAQLP